MSGRFEISDTQISGVRVIERRPMSDQRGLFERVFCAQELAEAGFNKPIAQINRTVTCKAGTVRGLHFQRPPHAEIKFISCIQGEIFDVVVDLRRGSPTFLKWHGEILSKGNHRSMIVPEGCAHGFQTLTDDCELLYFHSSPYAPEAEGGIHAQDRTIAITWPLAIVEMSQRDAAMPRIEMDFDGIRL